MNGGSVIFPGRWIPKVDAASFDWKGMRSCEGSATL